MSINRVHLVVIDPQNDFSDSKGALFVNGADADMKDRLPKMIRRLGGRLDDLHITLDSHHPLHIAHPIFWKDSKGNHPNPFTLISVSDVEKGVWTTTQPSLYKRGLDYVKALEKGGRYALVIWPPHCLIGSQGHSVVPELHAAITEWENNEFGVAGYITKGSNPFTEHYSGLSAEVQDPTDPGTQLNTTLINTLVNDADVVAVCGEALSHCVASTITDLVNNMGDPKYATKIVLLADAMSSVTGFEHLGTKFLDDMKAKGVKISSTTDFLK
jgi:nicotinamidase/pyrazinamidase